MSRLEEIEQRLAAATQVSSGHWRIDPLVPHVVDIRRERPMSFAVLHDENGGPEAARPDAELIAHAPADLAVLVDVVKAVRAARRDLDHHHSHMVPGRWDNDGSHCDVCARVGAMDDALHTLEAK